MIRRDWRRADSGASTVEAAVLMPVVILLTLVSIQTAIWYHGHTVVLAAAQAAGQDAASAGGTVETGKATAEGFLERIGGNDLHGARIDVTATDETVTVVITAQTTSLVPGWRPRVKATTQTPVERWTW